ncbi:sporulation protein YqfD [Oceanobacillus piezotolerans]|uniref:Sporulation protein YqfD n=1 Tax=Oceanobacillus piezotolerans TaxID=2448030 RepID=A0A498DET7_9BACI|nr:sporulation protein YqfD [Oceanobacillus piezotolerans]RLL48045.1 sporulation protein YqfD [Oceanobacillus piezotolerans]
MKQVQGTFITGYVTILIRGHYPELFFQKCTNHGITVWNIKKINNEACEGNMKLSDVKEVRKLIRKTHYKLSFIQKKGYPFHYKRFIRKKPLLFGLIISLFFIFFLSNIIWDIRISGVPKDIEEKIEKQLEQYGIHKGAWIFSIDSPNSIQQELIKDVPELLWVGVSQKGTTFMLEGVEKLVVKEEKPLEPRNLIASKKGVISNIYVAKGLPMVSVNDYVEPGDMLVSGKIGENEIEQEEKDDEGKEMNYDYVAAEGDITAKTWYEVNVTVPFHYNYEELTGRKEKKYHLKFGDFQLPIWGFQAPEFENIHYDPYEKPIHFFKWKLPVGFVESTLSEKQVFQGKRTKEEAIQVGVEQAKSELLLGLGPEAKILTEKVLHESIEDGKVNLSIYITVEEEIATAQPINQGD